MDVRGSIAKFQCDPLIARISWQQRNRFPPGYLQVFLLLRLNFSLMDTDLGPVSNGIVFVLVSSFYFLADGTNGRAIGTSSVVCDVMYCG